MGDKNKLSEKDLILDKENKFLFEEISQIYNRLKYLNNIKRNSKETDPLRKKIQSLNNDLQIVQYENLLLSLQDRYFNNIRIFINDRIQESNDNKILCEDFVNSIKSYFSSTIADQKSFSTELLQSLLTAFNEKNYDMMERCLDNAGYHGAERANIYDSLAQKIRPQNPAEAAELLLKAWSADPSSKRLKELTFCNFDCGEYLKAKACLNMLPDDIVLTDDDKKTVDLINQYSVI